MKLLYSKQGASLPFVLGIILFILTSTILTVTSVVSNNIQIENSYKRSEAYVNAQQNVSAVAEIMIRDQNLTLPYIEDLENHMNVQIDVLDGAIYSISQEVSDIKTVQSYLKTVDYESTTYDTYDSFLSYDGLETNYEKDPFLDSATILSSYLDEFLDDTFGQNTYSQSYRDFDSIFNYMYNLASEGEFYTIEDPNILENQSSPTVYGHWYIDGNVVLGNDDDLVVPDGYLLFIDGNLKMKKRSEIIGHVVVNGDVHIDSNTTSASLSGTVYASGNFTAERTLTMGTFWEPSFIIVDGTFKIQRYLDGYGYIFSSKAQANKNRTDIYLVGGVYADTYVNIDSTEVESNYWSWYVGLDGTAVPDEIVVVADETSGGLMIYTTPK